MIEARAGIQYVTADGRLTMPGLLLFRDIATALEDCCGGSSFVIDDGSAVLDGAMILDDGDAFGSGTFEFEDGGA